jgi:hypothetical protein
MAEVRASYARSRKRYTDHKTGGEIPTTTKDFDSIHVQFPALPTAHDDRESALLKADSYLNSLLATLDSYTVIYATLDNLSPPQVMHPGQYEMDEPYPSNMHTDLKRDLNSHVSRASNVSNPQADLPLFEKYQFLSPGTSYHPKLHFMLLHADNLFQESSWVASSASSFSPSSTSVSVPLLVLKSRTWPSARRWVLPLRRSRFSRRCVD